MKRPFIKDDHSFIMVRDVGQWVKVLVVRPDPQSL